MNRQRQLVVDVASSLVGRGHDCCETAAPGYDLTKKSWCQIFWLHCLREAGLTEKVWGDLARSGWTGGWLPKTKDPQPGDLAYIDQPKQHGAVVEWVDGDRVGTIDGNSVGRRVVRHIKPRRAYTAFYSIDKLLLSENTDDGVGPADLKEPA